MPPNLPPGTVPIGASCPLCTLRRIAAAVRLWVAFVTRHARLSPAYLRKKARDVRRFSATVTASGTSPLGALSVPSKLVGVLRHQDKLAALRRALSGSGDPFSVRLQIRVETGKGARPRLLVLHGDDALGEVQPRHVPWVLPLVGHGLSVHALAVTGDGTRTLGLNVAFGHVAEAVQRAEASAHDTTPEDENTGATSQDWPLAA